jgi:hypothetical protein
MRHDLSGNGVYQRKFGKHNPFLTKYPLFEQYDYGKPEWR